VLNLLFMRSPTYGDKQRDAQTPTSEAPANADKSAQMPNKTKDKDTAGRGSAEKVRPSRFMNLGDSYTCAYCLQVIKWDHHRTRPTRDHFFPKSKKKLLMGAKTTFVICCQPCNSRKSDNVFSSIEEARKFIANRKSRQRTNIDGN